MMLMKSDIDASYMLQPQLRRIAFSILTQDPDKNIDVLKFDF